MLNFPNIFVYIYLTTQTCSLFPAPAPQYTLVPAKPPTKHLAQRQLFPTCKYAPSCIHLSLCINSKPNSFNICSPGTSEEDDEELVSAATQCEAQLSAGVLYDTNANIVRVFSGNTKKYYFVENFYILDILSNTFKCNSQPNIVLLPVLLLHFSFISSCNHCASRGLWRSPFSSDTRSYCSRATS